MIPGVNELGNLSELLAQYDYEANRARTGHQTRLKDLASLMTNQRRGLSESLASQGMIHSGVNASRQQEIGSNIDRLRADANQQLNDRLANIGRRKVTTENQYNISRLMQG